MRWKCYLCLFVVCGLGLAISVTEIRAQAPKTRDRFERARKELVDKQIAREGIKNKKVLESMKTVPRHKFVPIALQNDAYFDQSLPIGHKQTISPPFIVAYMTELIDPQPEDVVLEIGTGSGYQAAILSGIVKEVYTIEIVEELGLAAKERLADLGYENVHVKVGDGYLGWEEHAPFDKIIVTCSPEKVPTPLVEQLREGGKMIIPLGERYQQVFHLLEKKDGKLKQTKLQPTLFVPMTGESEDQRLVKPDPLKPRIHNGSFENSEINEGSPDNWHYQRQLTLVKGEAPEGDYYVEITNKEEGRLSQAIQGAAISGTKIAKLKLSCWLRGNQIRSGIEDWQRGGVLIHFYDSERRRVGDHGIGPITGTFAWKQFSEDVPVPPAAREMIIHFGLNGAIGELAIDDIRVSPVPK